MISIYLNNIVAEMHSAVIQKMYVLLYDIKLSIKLVMAFCYRQSWICRNDVDKAKYMLFGQVKTLPLGAL